MVHSSLDTLSLSALVLEEKRPGLFTNSVATMLAISHSIEEVVLRHSLQGVFYAGFQNLSALLPQMDRYRRLAAVCGDVLLFAYPDAPWPTRLEGIQYVPLSRQSPLIEEWFLVCITPSFQVALLTRQLPDEMGDEGQRRHRGRFYEGIVTLDTDLVWQAQRQLNAVARRPPQPHSLNKPTEHDIFFPLLTFNHELIQNLETRNRELFSMYRRVKYQKLSLERLQQVVQRMVSRTAWEDAEIMADADEQEAISATARQRLTVLVTDIAGFTRLSEKLSLESVVQELNHYFDLLATAVYQELGDVDKFLGDGMLAFFQEPAAGLRAARLIQERVAEFNQGRAAPFPTRISLVTGPCLVARVGSRDRQEVTVLGDTVNTASRLQQLAPEGGILLDEETYRASSLPQVQGEMIALDGKQQPVRAYLLASGK